MEMHFTGKLSSSLKLDSTDFLVENLDKIKSDEGLNKSILSLCLENKAFNCFRYLVKNGFTYLYIISYGVALRENQEDVLNIINEFNLFDINGKQGQLLLNICISNKDDKLFEKIKNVVTPSEDVLMYALQGQNKEAIEIYQKRNYQWQWQDPSTNPLIYIYEIYQSNKKAFIRTVMESEQHQDILAFAQKYFLELNDLEAFNKLLPK